MHSRLRAALRSGTDTGGAGVGEELEALGVEDLQSAGAM